MVQSLFGMNIDLLASNPAWWIYVVFAVATMALTMLAWIIFKWNEDVRTLRISTASK
jgi:Mg2+ and Co2+ transporter CorA